MGTYKPTFTVGTRVVFHEEAHPKSGQSCTILAALTNPSQRSEHQWYDVRFDDYSVGRFLEARLQIVNGEKERPRVIGQAGA